jgi:hypothetical protein
MNTYYLVTINNITITVVSESDLTESCDKISECQANSLEEAKDILLYGSANELLD